MSVDIVESLKYFRDKLETPVKEAKFILSEEFLLEHGILENLTSKNKPGDYPEKSLLQQDRIYNLNDIKRVCIKYRLRFLDTSYFKGEFPYEAISEIKKLEK